MEHVLTRLKFIASIEPGQKISTFQKLHLVDPGWYTSFCRTLLTDESRESSYKFIEYTIMEAIDNLENNDVKNELEKTIVGINNLKKTYSSDTLFVCKLDTLIVKLKNALTNTLQETLVV